MSQTIRASWIEYTAAFGYSIRNVGGQWWNWTTSTLAAYSKASDHISPITAVTPIAPDISTGLQADLVLPTLPDGDYTLHIHYMSPAANNGFAGIQPFSVRLGVVISVTPPPLPTQGTLQVQWKS